MLGVSSESKLRGVHPDLVRVVRTADAIAQRMKPPVEFVVLEGLRTLQRQRELVASAASRTMDSRHLTGHAVDLCATVGGEPRWDWPLYYRLGDVMRRASINEGVPIVWGAVWDRLLEQLDPAGGLEDDVAAYVARRRSMGSAAFTDGPHFELHKGAYP